MILGLTLSSACKEGEPNDEGQTETETGDGDGDSTGDGDGDTGDGDGDTGDGDGDTTGDGDGDTTGDGDGDGNDDTNSGHGDGDASENVTIYEIQTGEVPLWGWVDVANVWVTGKRDNGVWVQELSGGPHSGIWVYVGEDSPTVDLLEIGDRVDVLGVCGKYNEVMEINALNGGVWKVGALDSPLPPSTITLDEFDAIWESVLVRVEGELQVTELPGEGEFIIHDGSASGYVDDYVYNVVEAGELADFGVGATFTAISGPLNYSLSHFKIVPRSAADLEGYQAP
jgi:hypothetical protein